MKQTCPILDTTGPTSGSAIKRAASLKRNSTGRQKGENITQPFLCLWNHSCVMLLVFFFLLCCVMLPPSSLLVSHCSTPPSMQFAALCIKHISSPAIRSFSGKLIIAYTKQSKMTEEKMTRRKKEARIYLNSLHHFRIPRQRKHFRIVHLLLTTDQKKAAVRSPR